jgi:hypothetical protein
MTLAGEGVEYIVTEFTDCCLLLEASGGDSEDSFTLKQINFFGIFLEQARYSEIDESLKAWLSFLERRNVHVDQQDPCGFTPLMHIISREYKWTEDTVRSLLAFGADVSLKCECGKQALHIALMGVGHRRSQLPRLIDGTDDVNPEWCEVEVRVLTCLVEAGADIYALDNEGNSPTYCAYVRGTLSLWAEALERCGLPYETVLGESIRRQDQWEADRRRLHGAKRTAVDAEILHNLSTEGLRKRRRQISQPSVVIQMI